jgi:predicted RNA binding protein YcfA (HicA-like mRNA interferase family)
MSGRHDRSHAAKHAFAAFVHRGHGSIFVFCSPTMPRVLRDAFCSCRSVYLVCIVLPRMGRSAQPRVIKVLQKDGWYEVAQVGSHKQFKHPTKPGRVTVPHPDRDIPIGTLKSIEKQAGIKLK